MFIFAQARAGGRLKAGLVILVILVQLALVSASFADTPALTPEDFTGFTGGGFAPSPAAGQLDSDSWAVTGFSDGDVAFGGTCTSGDCARGSSTGGVTTGGLYAFDVGGGDIMLGVQPGGSDFTPGTITLRLQNTLSQAINDLYVAYEIWTYNDQGRANSLNFSYSTDGVNFTPIAALDFTTPEAADAPPAWVSTDRSTIIPGINLAIGDFVYLRWTGDDVGGAGSRDEYGIDDVEAKAENANAITLRSLTASSGGPNVLPLAGVAALGLAGVFLLRRRVLS